MRTNREEIIKGWTISLQKLNRYGWEFSVKLINEKKNITLQKTISKSYRKLRKQYEYAIKWFQTEYGGDESG